MNLNSTDVTLSSNISNFIVDNAMTTEIYITIKTPDPTAPIAMETRTISLGLFISVCVLSSFGVAMATGLLVFNLIHKNDRLIKMSSPNINVLITLGGALLYSCAILFGLDYGIAGDEDVATIFCQTRTWLIVIAFTLVYGAMFSKTWRVYRIFTRAPIKRTVIRDDKLLLMVFVLILIDVTLLAFWQGFDPLKCGQYLANVNPGPKKYADPPSAPDEMITIQLCESTYGALWLAIIYFYKASLLLFGSYLAWATRNVTLPSMNDAKSIIISIYTCVILAAIATGLSAILVTWPNAWYACVSGAILVCTTQVLLMQNIPKIYAWKNTSSADLSKSITSSYLASSQNSSVDRIEEEYYMISAENAQLKKSLAEKEETIKTLQQHVSTAKDKLMQIEIEQEQRQDSGCDADMSSSSMQDDNEQGGSVDRNQSRASTDAQTQRRNSRRRLSWEKIQSLDWLIGRRKARDRTSVTSKRSLTSLRSWKQFQEARNSIADDLHKAHNISTNLRQSISKDLSRLRRRPLSAYSNDEIEKQLADNLRNCYGLTEADADSMVSVTYSCTYENPSFVRGYNAHVPDEDDMFCSCSCGHQHSRTSSFRSFASRISCRSIDSWTSRASRNSIPRRHSLPKRYRFQEADTASEDKMVRKAVTPEVVRSAMAVTRQIGTDTYV
ncbi:gamma-aminobutyric acid type B receptor subunit 2-like [Ptychodera flava]|uniref:gamma-aminobutyric acid type B receptor subunit 2-like n=1 Tax=Ptychodera flava TaxID=63121 RepID=UPI00396A4420